MGEAHRRLQRMIANGHVIQQAQAKSIRVVANLKLENQEGMVYMMIGDEEPELAIAMTPENVTSLIGHLQEHREMLSPTDPGEGA